MPYEAIIDGKRYSTATALEVCDVSRGGFIPGDFEYDDTSLYRSPKGRFFLAGEGGARSRWSTSYGNTVSGGSGIRLVEDDEARALVERYAPARWEELFGSPEEG